jgi:glycosyltransferase involved in cell wall biosynthesis
VWGALLIDKLDVIWTYQIGLPGVILAAIKDSSLIHEVQDLWPDWGQSATKGLTGWLFNLLIAQEKFIYRRAAVVTTISQGFQRILLERGVPANKVEIIPNWANDQNFRPVAHDLELGNREGLSDRFNVIYGGNVGAAQGLGVLLDAAALLQNLPELQFVIIGDGVERKALEERAKRQGLDNVRFLGSCPPSQIAQYFAFADVLFLHLVHDPAYTITIPSKTYAYLASGRPILAAACGDVAHLIRETGSGIVCPPQNPVALAEAIQNLYTLSVEKRDAMGQSGRSFFLKKFTRSRLVARYESLFSDLSQTMNLKKSSD